MPSLATLLDWLPWLHRWWPYIVAAWLAAAVALALVIGASIRDRDRQIPTDSSARRPPPAPPTRLYRDEDKP